MEEMTTDTWDMIQGLIPTNPDALKEYRMEIVDEWQTSRGVGFSGTVFGPTGAEFDFENLGDGGCNKYICHTEADRACFNNFKVFAKQAYPNAVEPEDMAVMWLEVRDLMTAEENN